MLYCAKATAKAMLVLLVFFLLLLGSRTPSLLFSTTVYGSDLGATCRYVSDQSDQFNCATTDRIEKSRSAARVINATSGKTPYNSLFFLYISLIGLLATFTHLQLRRFYHIFHLAFIRIPYLISVFFHLFDGKKRISCPASLL